MLENSRKNAKSRDRRKLLISSHFHSGGPVGRDADGSRPEFSSTSDLKTPKPMLPKLWDLMGQNISENLGISNFYLANKFDFNF